MRIIDVPIEKIYVPAAKRKTLDADKVEPLAEDILENGQQTPIYVRLGKDRYVLVEGLHRIEALKMLGETYIEGNIVQARKA
ncbi:ParB N-terminal domain-containing protein [bacterium AH-315-J23]|nr:ParB N-terminal domain-containing protein [bacterium AH-315-J23]PHQ58877.1 MAG: chromosome partitioning protein ParB [Robiginitomaculum sp.]